MIQTQELRASGIGGSDISIILGLNPYKTPLQLYMEKTGQVEQVEENDAMHFGNVLESVIADEYARRTGRKVARVNETMRHPEHPWMMAHIDRRVLNVPDGMLLECKTAGRWFKADEWGKTGTSEAPEYYITQVQHYLAVTGWQYADIAALLAGNDFRLYHFERDENRIAEIIECGSKFWEMVLNRIPPEAKTTDDIKLLYPTGTDNTIIADDDIMALFDALERYNEDAEVAEQQINSIKIAIQSFMGDNSILVDASGNKLATWKSQDRTSFDSKRFKDDNPELYKQYQKTTSMRVFR